MNRFLAIGLLVAVGVALALRLPQLGQRPMHNDEAVNAIKFGELWQNGHYRYDPQEYHGPSLEYATWLLAKLTGAPDLDRFSEARLRAVPVVFGAGLILLLFLVRDGLGIRAVGWAAAFLAVSPAMVFYSRYYIHEMLLVFFTLLTLGAVWRYCIHPKLGWALLAGAGLGLMHATKETFVITLAAAGLSLAANYAWCRWVDATDRPDRKFQLRASHLAGAVAMWLAVAGVLFSSFFTNMSGVIDSVRTYLPWLGRAGGASPHVHGWGFYLERLLFFRVGKGPIWTEAPIFALGLIGGFVSFARPLMLEGQAAFARFITLFTFALLAAYHLIAYKTPWCALSFWLGMILLAGIGATAVIRALRHAQARVALTLLLGTTTVLLGAEAWRAAGPFAADPRNPYVYAHTLPNILELVGRVESLAQSSSDPRAMRVNVITADGDYWPLPWYLRRLKQVGWYSNMPSNPYAPIMIVSTSFHAGLDEKKTHLMTGIYQLRPQVFFELYVELGLWQNWLAKREAAGLQPE